MTATKPLLVLIPDTNVLIHGKALVNLPWADFGRAAIELRIVSPVIKEIDQLKTQRGRPNAVARQLSSEIRELMPLPDRVAVVRASSPQVTRRVDVRTVTTSADPSLDLAHADQFLINYALTLLREGIDVRLLTNDTICQFTAEGVGLPVHYFPNDWLRPPESDETEKENARLKAEIQRLKAQEPKIELAFRDESGGVLTEVSAPLVLWNPLTEAELDELMRRLRERCPPASSFEPLSSRASDILKSQQSPFNLLAGLTARTIYTPPTAAEIEQYKTKDYPEWLDAVHRALTELHHTLWRRSVWPRVVAVAKNSGTRPAEQTLVTLRVRGALLLLNDDRDGEEAAQTSGPADKLTLPTPPSPPRGRTRTVSPLGLDLYGVATARSLVPEMPRLMRPESTQSDSFYWRAGRRGWRQTLELTCESWRHGRESQDFPLRIKPNQGVSTNGLVELSVEAHNLLAPSRLGIPVRVEVSEASTLDEARWLVESVVVPH